MLIFNRRQDTTRHRVAIYAISLIALLLAQTARGQFNMLFTSDYELPNSLVNKIAEDSNGQIWVATEDGLCRFNGSRFISYRKTPGNPNSLDANFVRTVCTDERGNTLIGGITGVQRYNPREDNFSEIIKTEDIGLPTRNVNNISLLRNGDFACIGVNTYNIHIDDDGNVSLKRNAFTGKVPNGHYIIDDSKGNLWAACSSQGVFRADSKGRITNIKAADGSQYEFTVFCLGEDGKVYAGNIAGGIYCYNEGTGRFDLLQGTESILKIRDVKAIPNTNTLCIATDGNGVMMYDVKTHSIANSQYLRDPFVDISSQKAHTLCISKDGDIWMGLYQKGIFLATRNIMAFGYIGRRSPKHNIIGNRCVTSIVQRYDGTIWVGTDNGGMYGITPQLELFRSFPADDAHGLPASLFGLFEDSKQRMWFGSYNHGCGIINVSTGACHYIERKGTKGLLYNVYRFTEDKRGQIWAASMGKGVLRYDEAADQMETYTDADGTTWTSTIYYDKDQDKVYCGTYDGVVWFSPTDKSRKTHVVGPNTVVYSIARLSKTAIGFGTADGLIVLDTKTGKTRQVTVKDGLSNSNIFALLPGGNDHVWLSSGGGLMRYDLKENHLETFTMKNGLQGNEFYKDASLMSSDGRLWFGGINGITFFSPNDVKDSGTMRCTSRVVNLRADERDICPDEDNIYCIPAGIDAVNIELATLPLYMTSRVIYHYRLDNGDWKVLPSSQNRIVFDKLSWGTHVLETKAVINGVESEVTVSKIYITYPWFLRWWAVIIWLIVIAIGAYITVKIMKRRREMKKALLIHMQEEEIKESKLQFFMNVVHDLRTPLTLIETPLQKLRGMGDDGEHNRLYDIMSRNTTRLLRLTNEIMDLRKLDRGKMQLMPYPSLISKNIREMGDIMSDIVSTRHQQLILTDHTDGKQVMNIDATAFDKILSNLLSNAIKYTPEGGVIEVEWEVGNGKWKVESGKCLVLSVTDNGIGISDEEKKHIFERFYQVRVDGKHVKGAGIGLNLVHSLIELHGGEISVTDNPNGQGTRFTVTIPECSKEEVASSKFQVSSSKEQEPSTNTQHPSTNTQHPTPITQHPTPTTHKTLLIVDDDDEIRTFLCEEMSATYNIHEATDGRKALEVLRSESIDLVISDVMMPEIDGVELVRKIREDKQLEHLPVILLTAKAADQDRLEGLQAAADAYVTKPFNLDLLQTLTTNILARCDRQSKQSTGVSQTGNSWDKENVASRVDTPDMQTADEKLFERLMKVINENLSNAELTTDFLAQEVGLSRGHLYRKLKELTNQSATNFIRNIRLTKAAELLAQKRCSISEVAYLVGFRTLPHFSSAFKELYGMTPREYMNEKNPSTSSGQAGNGNGN